MDLHVFFTIGGRFMFDREGFIDYVGAKSGNSYASGLARIENLYSVGIDAEYDKDKCDTSF